MLLRAVYIAVAAAALAYHHHVFGFVAPSIHPNKRPMFPHDIPPLRAKGFSKESSIDNKLGKEAAKCLKEAKGSLDVAQGLYFQSKLQALKASDPTQYKNLEAYVPTNRDEGSRQAHEKLVEYTWDTIAAYLPATSAGTSSTAEPAVSKKLGTVAQAVCFRPNAAVMDVGCGNGAIVPYLKQAGADLKAGAYLGLDLSSQMIGAAKAAHPTLAFEKANFLTRATEPGKYDAVLFNGVLQFFPSAAEALRRAASSLRPGGRVVIAHANGAGFVRGERRGNPNTVLTDMPDEAYIQSLGEELGATFIGLRDLAPSSSYDVDADLYLCCLSLP